MSVIVVLSDSVEASSILTTTFPASTGHEIVSLDSFSDRPAPATIGSIRDWDADVVVIQSANRVAESVGLAGAIEAELPDMTMVLITEPTPQLLGQAMRVGIREVVPPLQMNQELGPAVGRALEVAIRRRTAAGHASGAIPVEAGDESRLIAVIAPKGGAGKTVVATNLAVGLARARPERVVLVDGDLQFGDVNTALRLQPENTLLDVVHGGMANATAVKLHLTRHPSSLFVLAPPNHPAEADEISSADFVKVLDLLSGEFDFVVVDTDGGLGERTLAVLEEATDYVLVCATDVPSVRGLAKALDALDTIGFTTAKRHFLLNRADAKVGLDIDDIARTIGRHFDVEMPSSRTVPESVNNGVPILLMEEKTPVTRPLNDLVERFIVPDGSDRQGADAGRRGLFGRRE